MRHLLKKWVALLIMILAIGCTLPIVSADIGPKPSTTVTVVGLSGDYEFELLIPNRFSVAPAAKSDAEMIEQGWNDHPIYRLLNGYIDEDEYISWTLYNFSPTSLDEQDPTPEGWRVFKTGYYMRPPTYKVIILTPDEKVYVSESVTPAAFYSEVTVDFTGVVGLDATIPAFAFEAPGTIAEAIAWGP
ncbi:MAG: hypothetical protein Q8N15_04540, partial [Bacillota bacterium]|nr:hypothetical protein [Bacillota bacterium]